MSDDKKGAATVALEIVAGLISLIKGLIPAFLVSWNNYLRNEAQRLKSKIVVMKADKDLKEKTDEIDQAYAGKDSKSIISRYLKRRRERRDGIEPKRRSD